MRIVWKLPDSRLTAAGPPGRIAIVCPALTNWRLRTPRSTTLIVSIQSRFAISVSSAARFWPASTQRSPSNWSRLTAFQYVWREALIRRTSRPSRGQVIGP